MVTLEVNKLIDILKKKLVAFYHQTKSNLKKLLLLKKTKNLNLQKQVQVFVIPHN